MRGGAGIIGFDSTVRLRRVLLGKFGEVRVTYAFLHLVLIVGHSYDYDGQDKIRQAEPDHYVSSQFIGSTIDGGIHQPPTAARVPPTSSPNSLFFELIFGNTVNAVT